MQQLHRLDYLFGPKKKKRKKSKHFQNVQVKLPFLEIFFPTASQEDSYYNQTITDQKLTWTSLVPIIVKVMVVMETDGNEEYYVWFCKTG